MVAPTEAANYPSLLPLPKPVAFAERHNEHRACKVCRELKHQSSVCSNGCKIAWSHLSQPVGCSASSDLILSRPLNVVQRTKFEFSLPLMRKPKRLVESPLRRSNARCKTMMVSQCHTHTYTQQRILLLKCSMPPLLAGANTRAETGAQPPPKAADISELSNTVIHWKSNASQRRHRWIIHTLLQRQPFARITSADLELHLVLQAPLPILSANQSRVLRRRC